MSKHPPLSPLPFRVSIPPTVLHRLTKSKVNKLCVCVLCSVMKVFHFFILIIYLTSLDPENCGDFLL